MGLVMNTGSVISQLDMMNNNLEETSSNIEQALNAISEFEGTKDILDAESYDNIRKYYLSLHIPLLHGLAMYVDSMIQENNFYKDRIAGVLAGIGYIDEDELKRYKESLECQISHVHELMSITRGGYSDYLGALQRVLELVEKKLNQIGVFKMATGGLYQNVGTYKTKIDNCLSCINSDYYNVDMKRFDIESLGQIEALAELEETWKNRDLIDVPEIMTIEEAEILYEYIMEVNPTTYNMVYGSNEKYPTSVIDECQRMLKKEMVGYLETWKRWQELGDIEQITLEEIRRMDSLKRDENGIVYIDVDVEVPEYSFEQFQELMQDEEFRKQYLFMYNTIYYEDQESSIGRIAVGYSILNRFNEGKTVEDLEGAYGGFKIGGSLQEAEKSLNNAESDNRRNEVLAIMLNEVENPIGNRTYLFGRINTFDIVFEGEHVEDCIVVGSTPGLKNVYYFEWGTLHNATSDAEGIVIYNHETDTWSINNTEE